MTESRRVLLVYLFTDCRQIIVLCLKTSLISFVGQEMSANMLFLILSLSISHTHNHTHKDLLGCYFVLFHQLFYKEVLSALTVHACGSNMEIPKGWSFWTWSVRLSFWSNGDRRSEIQQFDTKLPVSKNKIDGVVSLYLLPQQQPATSGWYESLNRVCGCGCVCVKCLVCLCCLEAFITYSWERRQM